MNFRTEDLVWYLPACNQYTSILSDIVDALPSSGKTIPCYWSSTAVAGGIDSYMGSSASQKKTNVHYVRVCRK
ncbi:MAG: hypothetical protein ACI3Y2_02240 [Candidatus Egerieousia sp.]